MTKEEIASAVENVARYFPERMGGNEQIGILTARMAESVKSERGAVVELLRDWLGLRVPQSERKTEDGKREFWMWLALNMAKKYGLTELRPDIESLLADVRSGKAFLPYYEEMIEKYLG
jgi:hypothetical protein